MDMPASRESIKNTNLQKDALKSAGCEKVVTERISDASTKRPKLDKLLAALTTARLLAHGFATSGLNGCFSSRCAATSKLGEGRVRAVSVKSYKNSNW